MVRFFKKYTETLSSREPASPFGEATLIERPEESEQVVEEVDPKGDSKREPPVVRAPPPVVLPSGMLRELQPEVPLEAPQPRLQPRPAPALREAGYAQAPANRPSKIPERDLKKGSGLLTRRGRNVMLVAGVVVAGYIAYKYLYEDESKDEEKKKLSKFTY